VSTSENNPIFHAEVRVTLRKSILDPQGKAIHHGLESLGMNADQNVRIGKYIELTISAASADEASRLADEACRKLLANPVMEDYTVSIAPAPASAGKGS
jgi:phosphoribosylformylglycinamidine synthase subunit PurS